MNSNAAIRVAGSLARPDESDDAELLQRFVAERDDAAFAALVRRHGPMVLGVCRRVTGDWHLAEDAYQAAFVVLARKAAAVSPPGAMAGWLYGVAHRVAKDARRSALRRFRHERPVDALPDSPAPLQAEADDFRGVLDDELGKLPGKYRHLLVACDLEGRPRRPVAESLGIPEGTLSSRLTAARKMLANRLAKRGVAPAVAAGVAANGPPASAVEVPRLLLASAARIGTDAPGTVPAAVEALATGAIRAMTVTKTTTAGLTLVAVCLLAAGAVYAGGILNDPPPKPSDPPKVAATRPEAKPRPAGPNRLLFFRYGQLTLVDPDGKNEEAVKAVTLGPVGGRKLVDARLSPDARSVAHQTTDGLYVRPLDSSRRGNLMGGLRCDTFAWSPDGTAIAFSGPGDAEAGKEAPTVHGVVNLETNARTPLKLPADHKIIDWSPDGKFFLALRADPAPHGRKTAIPDVTLNLATRDGGESKAFTDPKDLCMAARFSPDGRRVICLALTPGVPDDLAVGFRISVLDLTTRKWEVAAETPPGGDVIGLCWSPDGKKIAYVWAEMPRVPAAELRNTVSEVRVIVCDADGKNAKTVATEKSKGLAEKVEGAIDWR